MSTCRSIVRAKATRGGAQSYYENALNEIDSGGNKANVLDELSNHPVFSPDYMKINKEDRIIHIALTYILRMMSMYIVAWGLENGLIFSFTQAFKYYMLFYISMYLLLVAAVNTGTLTNPMRTLLYYMNAQSNGFGRVATHIIMHVIVLPIPYLVRPHNSSTTGGTKSERYITSDAKRTIRSALSILTLFVWITTSGVTIAY